MHPQDASRFGLHQLLNIHGAGVIIKKVEEKGKKKQISNTRSKEDPSIAMQARMHTTNRENTEQKKKRFQTYIVVLLVRLVFTLGVSNLALEIIMVLCLEVLDTLPVTPLRISIDVHLDDTVSQRSLDVRDVTATSTVEDERDGEFVGRCDRTQLGADVLLCVVQDLRFELDITRLVDTVDVTECSRDGEHVRYLAEFLVRLVDFFRLRIQVLNGTVGIVHTVFFATGDTQFHLKQQPDLIHTLKVVLANR
mmetsp:Transcript_18783/g.45365  ORF Transcript_18783/g.45365 Transcript_18783/m.45365 type:complete len:251 (-) Transcript_18783:844-1596(-)